MNAAAARRCVVYIPGFIKNSNSVHRCIADAFCAWRCGELPHYCRNGSGEGWSSGLVRSGRDDRCGLLYNVSRKTIGTNLQISSRGGVNRQVLELAVCAAELADSQSMIVNVLELMQRNRNLQQRKRHHPEDRG
jgi:hypothetical protein